MMKLKSGHDIQEEMVGVRHVHVSEVLDDDDLNYENNNIYADTFKVTCETLILVSSFPLNNHKQSI